jgi:hypothetical protein
MNDHIPDLTKMINDGGPAFPDDRWQAGMTLRDYFAAAALQGIVAYVGGKNWDDDAKNAFKAADAMIKAREAK